MELDRREFRGTVEIRALAHWHRLVIGIVYLGLVANSLPSRTCYYIIAISTAGIIAGIKRTLSGSSLSLL